jgi:hypothetical protein
MFTIETGFRIIAGDDLELCEELIRKHDVRHVQIAGNDLVFLRETLEEVTAKTGKSVEYSYYLGRELLVPLIRENTVDFLFTNGGLPRLRFLIAPLEILPDLELSQPRGTSPMDSILKTAASQRTILCLESQLPSPINDKLMSESVSTLTNLKQAYPSPFLLFSIDVHDLNSVSNLPAYLGHLRNWTAAVTALIDQSFLQEPVGRDSFVELVDALFWLPFKQRPLIFANPISDVDAIYTRFSAITGTYGYRYP